MRARRLPLLLLLIAACAGEDPRQDEAGPASFSPLVGKVEEGAELIGGAPPSLAGVRWLDGRAHPLTEDAGKVVLVRWWTDGCPLCSNTAPAIAALKAKYGDDLVVRAVYHAKRPGVAFDDVAGLAERQGYADWLVGQDEGWAALKRWWLGGARRSYTSVTFLLGREGRIRAIHTGGEFHARDQGECLFEADRCDAEYAAVDRAIAALLGRPAES